MTLLLLDPVLIVILDYIELESILLERLFWVHQLWTCHHRILFLNDILKFNLEPHLNKRNSRFLKWKIFFLLFLQIFVLTRQPSLNSTMRRLPGDLC
jgi:hypothetical protein